MIPETELVKYGLTGITFALIYLISSMIKGERQIFTNHIEHNTKVMQSVKDSMDANTQATKELEQIIRELKNYFLNK